MTIFNLDLENRRGPKYRAIADALSEEIRNGRLAPGERLPTHRDLAWQLGVTVGTVSRAYSEMSRRELLSGEIGRGTFVKRESQIGDLPHRPVVEPGMIDLSLNFPAPGAERSALAESLREIASDPNSAALLDYQPDVGLSQHRTAGAQWIGRSGWTVDPSRLIITAGAQHAILTTLTALTRPGDRIVAEQLSYQGIKPAVSQLGLRVDGLPMDEFGLLPSAFEKTASEADIRALYCNPTLHNPTTATMPQERRREIAEIAERYDVAIIEDDIYSVLRGAIRPLSSYTNSHGYYLTSLSKTVAPGLRVGYVVPPPDKVEMIGGTVRASCWMAAPLMAELASRWIFSGEADRILQSHRLVAARRQDLAHSILSDFDFQSPPGSLHVWLNLPEPWRAEEFVSAMRRQGVVVAAAETFAIGRGSVPHAVRICLGTPREENDLERGLQRVAAALRHPVTPMPIRV